MTTSATDLIAPERRRSQHAGAETAAFFDFDGTLIDGYSAAAFLKTRASGGDMPAAEALRLLRGALDVRAGRSDFDSFMRVGVQPFRGTDAAGLKRLGDRLLKGTLGGLLFPEMLEVIHAHRRLGHRLVIASSALPFQVEPIAGELGFDDVLCTQLEEIDGVYTGRVAGSILWGPGKASAVRAYAEREGVDLERSYAYGNGDEDIEFLRTVGRPRPVNPGDELAETASSEGWPITHCGPRGRPGVAAVARTVAAYSGMAGSFAAGVGLGMLNGNRQQAVDFTASFGSSLAMTLAGVRLRVTGEENLERARPAVFIFNHQSILDGLIVMKLLRHDVTGVGKQELASQPGVGQFLKWANIALIDRRNTASAVAALAPVVDRLNSGLSIVIAPEGTRSPTPSLGAFKKGAFHMAMQGGVPIVPIVIRNAGELLWRGAKVMRTGTVDVHVLDPISVADWTVAELDKRIGEVREQFVATLADWPRP